MPLPTLLYCLLALCAAEKPVARFADVAFDDIPESQEFPPLGEVEKLFTPVDPRTAALREKSQHGHVTVQLQGLFRLRETWSDNAALRLSLVDLRSPESQLRLYFWNGQQGIAACWYGGRRPGGEASVPQWGVYAVQRSADAPHPDSWQLWGTDEGRYHRLQQGTFTVHYCGGRLAMTRGDLLLWSVPFAGPPAEVYLDTQATLRGYARFSCAELPPAAPDLPLSKQIDKPAELDWQKDTLPDGVRLEPQAEGRVRLAADPGTPAAHVTAVVASPGLQDYAFEFEAATAGSGLLLADSAGNPLARVICNTGPDGRLVLALDEAPVVDPKKKKTLRAPREPKKSELRVDQRLVPYAGAKQWLRLLLGAGVFHVWISPDGAAWSQVPDLTARLGGAAQRIGLYVNAGPGPRSITLDRVQVRRFETLQALVPEAVWKAAILPADTSSFTRWLAAVESAQPAEIRAADWLKGCLFRALVDGCSSHLGQPVLLRLLEESASPDVDAQFHRLLEAARLSDATGAPRLVQLYEPEGRRLVEQRDATACSRLHQAVLRAPLPPEVSGVLFPPMLLRFELLLAVYENRWNDVAAFARRVQYYGRGQPVNPGLIAGDSSLTYLLEWALTLAKTQLPTPGVKPAPEEEAAAPAAPEFTGKSAAARRAAWLRQMRKRRPTPLRSDHPLVERFDREVYNSGIDFQAALVGTAYREACQFMIKAAPALGDRLFPQADDPQWRTSLPVAFAAALGQSPELLRTLRQEFGALGELRVKESIAAGDAVAVATAVRAFPRTAAAALALRWLGDRALSAGHFSQAAGHFQTALNIVAEQEGNPTLSALQPDLRARCRLSGALEGRALGEPPVAVFPIAEQSLTPPQFEQVVNDLLRARQSPTQPAGPPPAPSYLMQQWNRLPIQWEGRDGRENAAERQLPRMTAVTFTPGQMVVNSPNQILAFDLADAHVRWSLSAPVPESIARTAAVAYQPISVGSQLLVRRQRQVGAELVCLELSDGRVRWTTPGALDVVADPLWVDEQLLTLTATPTTPGNLAVQLARLDPRSGELLAQWPLIELRDLWKGQLSCRMAVAGDRIVASLAGCTLAFSTSGQVHWLRLSTYFPGRLASGTMPPLMHRQIHEPPLVCDGRVYVAQPGVWTADCLDLATGRLLWRQVEPELKRLIGIQSGKLLVEMSRGITAVDVASGKPAWRYIDPYSGERAEIAPQISETGITCLAWNTSTPQSPAAIPAVVWLDSGNGEPRSSAPILSAKPAPPGTLVGSLFSYQKRLWVFLALGGRGSEAQLIELLPR